MMRGSEQVVTDLVRERAAKRTRDDFVAQPAGHSAGWRPMNGALVAIRDTASKFNAMADAGVPSDAN